MKKEQGIKLFFFLALIITTFIISSCVLDIQDINQPENGYTNSKVITTIRANLNSALGTGYYSLSILVPTGWEIENDQVKFKLSNSEQIFAIAYEADNVIELNNSNVAPEGYYWWSGNSSVELTSQNLKVVAYVVFNTGSVTGDYNLKYCIGDSRDHDLQEYDSGLLPITITAQTQTALLHNGTVFPEIDSYSWNDHAFEVAYNSLSRTIPTSTKLYFDGIAYDLELLAGSADNGRYGVILDPVDSGNYDYYFLFDNSLRYPAGSQNLELTINDVEIYDLPLTENFETSSETWDSWEVEGDWQIGQAMGNPGNPTTAYEGITLAGTNITGDGMTTPNTTSYLKSPIFDARQELDISLNFYHYSTFSPGSELSISLEFLDENRESDIKTFNSDTSNWQLENIDLSSYVTGKIFRVIFAYTTGATPSAGSSLDLVAFGANHFSEADFYVADSTLVADKGESVEFLLYLENTGTETDTYDLSISGDQDYSYQLQRADQAGNWSNIDLYDINLGFAESAELKLIATIPFDTNVESEEIELLLNSDNGIVKVQNLTTKIRPGILGNDNYGYVMYSSDYSDLAELNWISLQNPTHLTEYDLIFHHSIELGFEFPYYDNNYYSFYLTPYGGISFDNPSGNTEVEAIPDASDDNSLVGLYWEELDLEEGGGVYYEQITIENQAALVLTFDQCYTSWSNEESFTAQMILLENGNIKFQYLSLPNYVEKYYPIVGIEDYSGTDGISFQAGYNALKSNYALLFSTELVAKSAEPAMYSSAPISQDLSWTTTGDFASMKVYLKENDYSFTGSDLIYTGAPINMLANEQLPQLSIGSSYYWRIVGVTADGYEIASKNYNFNIQNSNVASGTVTDSYSHLPLEGVLVRTMDDLGPMKSGGNEKSNNTRVSVLTDANGYWSMPLAANGYYFEFSKDGYETMSLVYLNLYEDNVLDVELNNQGAYNPNPGRDARNVSISPNLSWTNPAGYNHTKIEIANNENMNDAQLVYEGALIDNYNTLSPLENSSFYYWQVTLSHDGLSNFAQSNIWRFLTESPETAPTPDYTNQFTNYSVRKATKVSSGYLLPGGDYGAAQQIIKTDEAGNIVWQNSYSTVRSTFIKALELSNGNYLVIRDQNTDYINGEETGLSEVTASGNVVWNQSYKYYEGNSFSNEDVSDGILDSSNRVVICGGTGFNDWDFLLTKAALNSDEALWQKTYGNEGAQEQCYSVIEAASGGYIMTGYRSGTTTNDIGNSRVLVVKVNSSGSVIWEYEEDNITSTDGITSTGYKAIENADGSLIVVGNAYNHNTDFESNNAIVIKLSASGDELWKKYFPLQDYSTAKDVAVDSEGNIYLTGNPDAMKLDSEGNLIWYYNDADYSVGNDFTTILLTDNGFTIAGGNKITIFGDNTTGLLSVPQNLNVNITGDQVELTWDSVSGATYYRVYSATEPSGSYDNGVYLETNSWYSIISGNRKFFKVRAFQ